MKLIRKDKHIENLVEKLCLRYTVISTERQWRDVAFCLSLLSYNEKAIKKLIDNMNTFKTKILNDDVYDAFKSIISNTAKLAKQPLKELVKELEYKVEELRNGNVNNEEGEDGENVNERRTQQRTNASAKKVRRKQNVRSKKRGGRFAPDSDDDDDFESDNDRENQVPAHNSRTRRATKNATTVVESDNSSSDSEERQRVVRSKRIRK